MLAVEVLEVFQPEDQVQAAVGSHVGSRCWAMVACVPKKVMMLEFQSSVDWFMALRMQAWSKCQA